VPKAIHRLKLVRLLAPTALGVHAATLEAQEPQLVDISPCVAIESGVARLDCYDALARSAREAAAHAHAPAPAPAPAPAQSVRAAPPASNREARAASASSSADAREAAVEIASEVAELREIQPGRLEITLTNGQIWRQVNSDRYRLRVGHEVVLYPTRFGEHYRLTAPALRGFIQVDRVR